MMIKITFPNNSVKEFESGITPLQIAESISPRLAQEVLAATVDGQEWDLSRSINADAAIKFSSGTIQRESMHFGILRHTCWPRHYKNCIPVLNSV